MIQSNFKELFLYLCIIGLTACHSKDEQNNDGLINTVTGPLDVADMGFTLTHEHLMSNFGKDISEAYEYDEDAVFTQVIPYVKKIKSLGVNTIFDCTTDYFGRRVDILKTIADSTGIHIVTNTGFYGAANDRYVPEFAFEATSQEIAEIWIDEYENGIDDTGIRPGFIKLAFDDGQPSQTDLKLFEAGILTHLKTGLTIVVHTGNNTEAARQQINMLEQYDVSPQVWVWVHANHSDDIALQIEAASSGAWISIDGVNESNVEEYIVKLDRFKSHNLLDKILLSHDGDGYPMGGEIRRFEAIPKYLIPAMRAHGFTEEEINQIMVKNPKEAFITSIR